MPEKTKPPYPSGRRAGPRRPRAAAPAPGAEGEAAPTAGAPSAGAPSAGAPSGVVPKPARTRPSALPPAPVTARQPKVAARPAPKVDAKPVRKAVPEPVSHTVSKPAAKAARRRAPKVIPAPVPAAALALGARRRAVANAAAAAQGRSLAAWRDDEIAEAFTRFAAREPEPKGELEHHDPFTLLVAVVLSAQATDAGVNKATRGLFAKAPTPAAMVALGEAGVAEHIRTLGLYKGKAKNVVELSRRLLAEHGGKVPQVREALEALPGVGRKTANVVLNMAFGHATIAVDTHLFRVGNRTGLAPGPTPLAVEEQLEARIPARFKLHAHHWLILHGRYVCKARVPDCGRCIIADLCRWPEKTL